MALFENVRTVVLTVQKFLLRYLVCYRLLNSSICLNVLISVQSLDRLVLHLLHELLSFQDLLVCFSIQIFIAKYNERLLLLPRIFAVDFMLE